MLASDLKVYRDTYKFVKIVENARKEYSKAFKYSLGEKTFNTAIDLFEYIQLANMFKENRRKYLEGFIRKEIKEKRWHKFRNFQVPLQKPA